MLIGPALDEERSVAPCCPVFTGSRTWRGITNLRPSTRLRDDATFHNHIPPTFGAVPLARVDRTSLREWVAGLSDPDGSALAPANDDQGRPGLQQTDARRARVPAVIDGGEVTPQHQTTPPNQ